MRAIATYDGKVECYQLQPHILQSLFVDILLTENISTQYFLSMELLLNIQCDSQ